MAQRQGKYVGRVLLVVGGASGIGREAALLAARQGADVAVLDCQPMAGLGEELRACGGRVAMHVADVTDETAVRELCADLWQTFGRLDALINAAGIAGPRQGLLDCDLADFQQVLAVNLLGTVACCKHALPLMVRTGGGRICNIASIAGETGLPMSPAYAASKAGVISVTRSLAADLAIRQTPVQVNALCPGWTDTPFLDSVKADPLRLQALRESVPNGRLAESWEVASAAVWMALEAPWYLNGETIRIDGGLLSSSPTHVRMMRDALQAAPPEAALA